MSKISIIIPVYNAEKYLRKCLDSILNQTFQDFEIICIDDGSTDKSLEILQEYKRKDDRFVILQQRHAGAEAAKNNGVRLAESNRIHFLEADKFYEPDFIESKFVKPAPAKQADKFSIELLKTDKDVIPVVFSFNNDYCKYFAVALQSLIENSKNNYLYDIIVFSSDISIRNKNLLYKMLPDNFSLRFYYVSGLINNFGGNTCLSGFKNWSVEMYYRLLIPIIMRSYDRVLYLDSDIICKSDIVSLFKMDFEEKWLIAIPDTFYLVAEVCPDTEDYLRKFVNIQNLKSYFNSGVLLFNNKSIDPSEYSNKVKKAFNIELSNCPDQDILNIVFANNVKLIEENWNLQYHLPIVYKQYLNGLNNIDIKHYKSAFIKPDIIHYTSSIKPWFMPEGELSADFWHYARKTDFYEEILYARTQAQIIKMERLNYLYRKIRNGKNIVLWGASLFLEEFFNEYKIESANISGVVDSDPRKKGKPFCGYKIYSPEEIKNLNVKEIIITIVNADYSNDIKTFLEKEHIYAELDTVL